MTGLVMHHIGKSISFFAFKIVVFNESISAEIDRDLLETPRRGALLREIEISEQDRDYVSQRLPERRDGQ
jgi:hypothetical protein